MYENEDEEIKLAMRLFPLGETILVYTSPDKMKEVYATNLGPARGVKLTTRRYLDPLIEQNQREANAFNRLGSHGDGVKVARVPNDVILQWDEEERSENDRIRWLNDPDNAKFRTTHNWRL